MGYVAVVKGVVAIYNGSKDVSKLVEEPWYLFH